MKKVVLKRELINIVYMLVAVTFSFFSLWVFVEPANFSPSGIDGVSRILQEITKTLGISEQGVNMGFFKLILNVPLLILAWIFLNKKYVIYVLVFTLIDSLGIILLEEVGFYQFAPEFIIDYGVGHRLIASIFSGVALGVCTGLMLKIGCSTGGVDIIACLVHKKKPLVNIERIISIICYIIILGSYFVFWDLTSVLLSIIQIFVFEWTSASLLRKQRYALEVKVITKHPELIRDDILYKYNHSATIIKSNGMYSGDDNYTVISVLNARDIAEFMEGMKKYPDAFVYFSDGVRVQGDFHFGDEEQTMSAYKEND